MTSIATSTPDAAPPPASAGATPRPPQPTRTSAREQRQQGDAFDRVLRRKTGDICGRPAPDDAAIAGACPLLQAMASALPMTGFAAPPRAAEGAPVPMTSDANAEAARAAFGGALHGDAGATPVGMLPGDQAAAWHVSLNDPLGMAVELRVTRPAGTGTEAAPWTLTVGSDARDAALLARHAASLDARLRLRTVALSHVRIEAGGNRGDEADDAHSG
jgi:hypothetical protein